MGFIIDEKNFINDNIFKYEKRLESQYSIFLDKSPTFVTYYHINDINTTTDNGLLNIDDLLGPNSPLKFQKVEDFPLYGIEAIQLDLSEEDEGLNTSFTGDAIILPNTIKPLPNDFFIISYLNNDYMFMVDQIAYDTIKSNNFYRISYSLRSTDASSRQEIDMQVLDEYKCIFKNIGTDDNFLLEKSIYESLGQLKDAYIRITDEYMKLYYSKKFNSFILMEDNVIVYDKFLTHFINSNQLFNEREKYNTIFLNNEDYGIQFPITYNASVYRTIETRNIEKLKHIRYWTTPITYQQSIFKYYSIDNVRSVTFFDSGDNAYIPDSYIDNIKCKNYADNAIFEGILNKYFNNENMSIADINIDNLLSYNMEYSRYDFVMVPIVLYIIKQYIMKMVRI